MGLRIENFEIFDASYKPDQKAAFLNSFTIGRKKINIDDEIDKIMESTLEKIVGEKMPDSLSQMKNQQVGLILRSFDRSFDKELYSQQSGEESKNELYKIIGKYLTESIANNFTSAPKDKAIKFESYIGEKKQVDGKEGSNQDDYSVKKSQERATYNAETGLIVTKPSNSPSPLKRLCENLRQLVRGIIAGGSQSGRE